MSTDEMIYQLLILTGTQYTVVNLVVEKLRACDEWAARAGEAQAKLAAIRELLSTSIVACVSHLDRSIMDILDLKPNGGNHESLAERGRSFNRPT